MVFGVILALPTLPSSMSMWVMTPSLGSISAWNAQTSHTSPGAMQGTMLKRFTSQLSLPTLVKPVARRPAPKMPWIFTWQESIRPGRLPHHLSECPCLRWSGDYDGRDCWGDNVSHLPQSSGLQTWCKAAHKAQAWTLWKDCFVWTLWKRVETPLGTWRPHEKSARALFKEDFRSKWTILLTDLHPFCRLCWILSRRCGFSDCLHWVQENFHKQTECEKTCSLSAQWGRGVLLLHLQCVIDQHKNFRRPHARAAQCLQKRQIQYASVRSPEWKLEIKI